MDSVKPIGIPQGTAKPAKVSSVDFEAIVAGKVKNVAKFSPPDDQGRGASVNQNLVESDTSKRLMSRLDFAKDQSI